MLLIRGQRAADALDSWSKSSKSIGIRGTRRAFICEQQNVFSSVRT
jgi:hypothetical protein